MLANTCGRLLHYLAGAVVATSSRSMVTEEERCNAQRQAAFATSIVKPD